MTYVLLYVIEVVSQGKSLANRDGPGGIRTLDLGIRSPTKQDATNGSTAKRPGEKTATAADHRCDDLQLPAAFGDKPVRHLYVTSVDVRDNDR